MVDGALLQEVQERFSVLAEVPLLFVTPEGLPVTASPDLDQFCCRFTQGAGVDRPCLGCGRLEATELPETLQCAEDDLWHRCPLGVRDVAAPVVVEGQLIGLLVTAQVRTDPDDELALPEPAAPGGDAPANQPEFRSMPAQRLRDTAGAIVGVVRVIAEVALQSHRNHLLAVHDGLTGLYNYRQFHHLLDHAFAVGSRYLEPLSVLVLDLDHFKHVNDTHGHLVGDTALRAVAERMHSHMRRSDVAARCGGDEFVLLLPRTGAAQARSFAERLRSEVRALRVPSEQGACRLDCSIGLASTETCAADNSGDLVAAADRALYTAKRDGRGRVAAFASPSPRHRRSSRAA